MSFEDPFLQSVLEETAKEQGFKKPEFSVKSGSKPGDNYTSRIFRAVITEADRKKSLSVIVKVSPLSQARLEKTNSDVLFRIETDVYQTILPTLNRLLNKYGVVKSDIFPGTVRCFTAHLDDVPSQVLVLEDKSVEGFGMIGDSKSLDAEHCRQVLKYLALWHAASLALQHHEPETAERFKKLLTKEIVFTDPKSPIIDELILTAHEGLTFLQEPYKEGNDVYEKLKNIVQNYRHDLTSANEVPTDLSCIIHGDCWYNNFLYKLREGKLEDVCLIDLQIARCASPVIDITYMFFLCTTKDVRDASYDELIRFYHVEVSSHLKMMECDPEKIFSWDRLQDHLKKYGKMGLMIALSGIHICLAESSEINVDLHSAEGDDTVFAGRVTSWDPKKREEISKRLTGVIEDGVRWGYI